MRKIIIIMSDAREEAAVAREALVRGKKKEKKQTTLMTKWNIVLDYGESGVSMADYCAEYNGREGRYAYPRNLTPDVARFVKYRPLRRSRCTK